MPDTNPAPRLFRGVMISSTFNDLKEHRAALIAALKGEGLTDIAMENDTAKPDVDVIGSSLRMVGDASAYVVVISHKYGQTPVDRKRNPNKLSITELEFNEALRLDKARAVVEKLGAEIPNLPPYDSTKDEKLPWEDEVAVIEQLRAEKEAGRRKKD